VYTNLDAVQVARYRWRDSSIVVFFCQLAVDHDAVEAVMHKDKQAAKQLG